MASEPARARESRSDYLEKDLPACGISDMSLWFPHSILSFLRRTFITVYNLLHQLDHPVELLEHGRVMAQSNCEEFVWEIICSHCVRVRHQPQDWAYLVFYRFDPESVCDRALEELSDDVESELVRFPSKNKPWVSQHPSLFVTDILRANPLHVFYTQGFEVVGKVPSDRAGTTPPPDPGNELLYDWVRIATSIRVTLCYGVARGSCLRFNNT